MPPKPKYSKEEIVECALQIVREQGKESISARNVGKKLNVSATTVFTHFSSMEELHEQVRKRAEAVFDVYAQRGFSYTLPFKGYAMEMLNFAQNERNLFSLLFLDEKKFSSVKEYTISQGYAKRILTAAEETFHLGMERSAKLIEQLYVYVLGLASLITSGEVVFSEEQKSNMISEACLAFRLLLNKKEEEKNAENSTSYETVQR